MSYRQNSTIREVFSNLTRFGFAADWEGSSVKEKCNFVGEVTGQSKADWTMRALIKLIDDYITEKLPNGKWFQMPSMTMAELIPRSVTEPDPRKAREELHRLTQKAAVRVLNEIRNLRDHKFMKSGLLTVRIDYETPPSTEIDLTIEGVAIILRLPEFRDFYKDYQDELRKREMDVVTRYKQIKSLAKPSYGRVELPTRPLSQVILSKENHNSVSLFIKSAQSLDKLYEWGVNYSPKMLISGVIGTGKSILAEAIAKECKKGLYRVGSDDLIDSYLGESAKRVRACLSHAQAYSNDLILFIDEADGLLGSRGHGKSGASREVSRAVNTFLSLIETMPNVIMIAATNHPHLLDPAAFSRFTQRIWVDAPDKRMIKEILVHHLANIKFEPDIDLDHYTMKLHNEKATGRDIRNMIAIIVQIMINEERTTCDITVIESAFEQLLESLDIQKYGKIYGAELYADGFDIGDEFKGAATLPTPIDERKFERRMDNIHKDLSDEIKRIWGHIRKDIEDDPSKEDEDPWKP